MVCSSRCRSVDDVQHAGIELVANSSPEDLENLFIREYAKVARFITRITRDQSHAEDLAVEVFLKVSRPNSSAMLYRQAVRLALDEVRRRNRRRRLRQLFSAFLAAGANPENEYAVRERQVHVGLILQSMRRRDAELLLLRAEGLTYAELSNALSINPASVGIMLFPCPIRF